MESEHYPAGPDLSELFPKPNPPLNHSLPPAFDDSCKKCDKPMQRLVVCCWTRHKPYTAFSCEDCKLLLFLFEAPVTALLVWSDSYHNEIKFSQMIEERIVEREKRRHVRALREQGIE